MELYWVCSIVDWNKGRKVQKLYNGLHLSVILTSIGTSTATTEHLLLYDLEPGEKAVISTIAGESATRQLFRQAKRELYIDVPGNGILFSVPVKSIGGGKTLSYLTDGQTVGGAAPKMDFENELIVVILNEGFSDMVMDAARKAGATGGTVLHTKGTGKNRSEKFFGVSLAEEKDMLYILSAGKKKTAIMQEIQKKCGPTTQAGAICFSLPVSEVAGVRRLEDDT